MSRIKELRQKKVDIVKEMKAILAIAEGEKRDLSEEEKTRWNGKAKDVESIQEQIEREEKILDLERAMPGIPGEIDPIQPEPKKFESLGNQLQAVYRFAQSGYKDPRLIWGAASGASEGVPSEGGFLVQEDFSLALLDQMHEMGDILSRVRRIPISEETNRIVLPAFDETSRVDGSRFGGVRAYWANEADTVTASKPKYRNIELSLQKLFALAYSTEELLADARALESVMSTAFLEELTFNAEDTVVNGTGAGQPLGILNSGALISVAKDSGQTAATVTTTNVLGAWARLPRRNRRNAVWLINQDVEPQLYQLVLGSGTAVVLLYTPPGVRGNEFGMLLGAPVIPVEYCATLGTVGDIILADLNSYLFIDKGGQRAESSMHVRFLYDEMTFRWIYRLDGQPAVRSAVTPYKGSNTQSPFIAVATRA